MSMSEGSPLMVERAYDWGLFALLLIDMQADFWSAARAQQFPQFSQNVARLLTFCRAEELEIIHLRASFQPDRSDWLGPYKVRGAIPCLQGTPGIEPLPWAQAQAGEVVFVKHTFDGFYVPELGSYLRQRGKRFLLTAGLVTSTCVLLTTASAVQHGFLAAVVEDCCADEPDAHAFTLAQYPFIFERTTVDHLREHYLAWGRALQKLASTGGSPVSA